MTTDTADNTQEMIYRSPGSLAEGDVINDVTGLRAVEIRELYPITIRYHREIIPVWYVRGEDTRPVNQRTVKMLLVPRFPVQVIRRRGGVVTPAG